MPRRCSVPRRDAQIRSRRGYGGSDFKRRERQDRLPAFRARLKKYSATQIMIWKPSERRMNS